MAAASSRRRSEPPRRARPPRSSGTCGSRPRRRARRAPRTRRRGSRTCRRRERAPASPPDDTEPMETRLVEVADTRLVVREWGDATGRPLLFWHALGDHTSLQPIEVAPILVRDHGFHVLAPDAPGFGGSPRLPDERYQLPELADLARDLLDALELDPVVWVGSSWGGNVGVAVAATHPERVEALVLLDGGYLGPSDDLGASLEMIRDHWRSQPELWSYDSWEAVDEDARKQFTRWTPELAASCRSAYREDNGRIVSIM